MESIKLDAWGRPKTITDKSLFSSKFTFDIPDFLWLPVEASGDGSTTTANGELIVNSGTSPNNFSRLRSRRHMTYQPNRGHLYSTALMIPDVETLGTLRRWGLYYEDANYQSGVLFELVNGTLYGKIITTIDGAKQEEKVKIDIDPVILEGGALFDIQFQWRGVGDYFFYINQELVAEIKNLEIDNDTHVTIINPSLPVQFEAINKGAPCELRCGCVDVTSEGGQDPFLRPLTVDTNMPTTVADAGSPMLVLYVPNVYQGQHNSRDVRILKGSLGLADTGAVKIMVTRDPSAFGIATLGDTDGEQVTFSWSDPDYSSMRYCRTATVVDETKCKLVDAGYIAKAGDNIVLTLSTRQEVTISHGDYLILYGEYDKTGTTTGYGSITIGEEI